ncbi:4'-phosphopantetheinyl transferase family protein [Streptomyces sp. NPDC020681]|uniref:4'-phosphopantetheinyl transferase family protein n=1 Tax=Streptomyces sp. NPDC020681 TaxID=3365083 RepID=UPI0037AC0B06
MYRTADRPRIPTTVRRHTSAPLRLVADLLPPAPAPLPRLRIPTGGRPRVWLVDVTAHAAGAEAVAAGTLGADERNRAAAFMHREDREAYLTSHVALRRLLAAYTDARPQDIDLVREPCPLCARPHGRPALSGEAGPHFSLSHTRGAGLIAVSATPVGVDGEALSEIHVSDELSRLLHPREQEELAAAQPADRTAAFARAWTRKEAYLKGLGTGLGRSSTLDYVGAGPVACDVGPDWRVQDLSLPPGLAGAVAWHTASG